MLLAAVATMGGQAWAQANLVRIDPRIDLDHPANLDAFFAYDVNSVTGDYVVCYSTDSGSARRILCQRYDADDSGGSGFVLPPSGSSTEATMTIDVALADNGDFYLAWMRLGNGGTRNVHLAGWNALAASKFEVVVDPGANNWLDISVAVNGDGVWVGATKAIGSFSDFELSTRRYDRNSGALIGAPTVMALYTGVSISSCGPGEQLSDIAVTRSGDVALAWLKPSFYSGCIGTVMTRTMRASGFLGNERQLTAALRDNGGHDASPNRYPRIVATDDDRFVVGWGGKAQLAATETHAFTAIVDRTANIVTPATQLLVGPVFQLAVNPVNGDYVVAANTGGAVNCTLEAQVGFEGGATPVTRFPLPGCGADFLRGYGAALTPDGRMGLVRALTTLGGLVTLNYIHLPAVIEVNNVSVSEGNPGPGAPPKAVVSVTMNKPQPAGQDVHVQYFTRNGSATAGQDFALTHDTATFAAGTTTQTVEISLLPDTRFEDNEHFTVEFEAADTAVIRAGDERAHITLLNDDRTPPISADCTDSNPLTCKAEQEPAAGQSRELVVRLDMAEPVGSNVQINYMTADGTAVATTPTVPGDYLARSGSVQIIAGATTATIPMVIYGDAHAEDTETFHLRLSASDSVHLSATDLVIHIVDSDACDLEVAQTAFTPGHAGSADEQIHVTASPTHCTWTATSTQPWITLAAPPAHAGNDIVHFSVAAYSPPPGEFARNGSIVIRLDEAPNDSITVQVDQAGDCTYVTSAASQAFGAAGGEGTFTVTASAPRCPRIVESPASAPWITILSPLQVVLGSGSVRYRVDANADDVNVQEAPRTSASLSENFSFTVSQAGCDYEIDTPAISVGAVDPGENGGAAFNVEMDADDVCRWTAISHKSWILIEDGAAGSGEGTVEIFVLDNPGVDERVGTVSIGSKLVVVTQAGLECDYALAPASIASCPDGRAFLVDIRATDGCHWTLHEEAPWITALSPLDGVGDDTGSGVVDLNLSENARAATLQLRAQNVGVADTEITQEGFLTYEVFDTARPADWSYAPDAAWSTAGGSLLGQAGAGVAMALDQASICSECEVEATVAVNSASSAPGETLTVLGWYRDAGNHVGVAMDEFSNRWTLFQIVNGTRTSVTANVDKIIPNTFYEVRMVFDGTGFFVDIDGRPVLQMARPGDPPRGSAGLRLAASSGRLGELRISRLKAAAVTTDPEHFFTSSFEADEIDNVSACELPNGAQR
jgi:hypothetical protein